MTSANPQSLSEAVAALRALLDSERVGALSTLSLHCPGWPFGSMTPFALTAERAPFFVLSDLAEHTKNLKADPRASLLVTDSAARNDPQSGARVTLVGTVSRVTDAESLADLHARWNARLPSGRTQLSTSDFGVYVLTVENIRFIGGFAMIRWVSARELA